jgi:succinate-semialdehyde dehydrogenase/glutarate-semialdehyde dehydrogenase
MERIYLPEARYDEFAGALVDRVRRLRLGAGGDADLGSLISTKQLEAVDAHVRDALDKGATVLVGGRPRRDVGPCMYEPTVLAGVTPEMTLHAEETFGPVVSLYRHRGDDDAVRQANDSRYGLNFSIFTEDTARAERVAARLEAGTVNVNEGYAAAWGSTDAPMGGFKDSGLGRRHGAQGIVKFTEPQTVAVQRGLPMEPPPWVSQALWERGLIGSLRLLRRLPLPR